MKIAIVTDSNSGITQEEGKQLGIRIVPMPFMINGEEYLEDITLTQQEFYAKLGEGSDISTSATLIRTGSSVFFSPASHDTSRQLKNMYIENLVVVILFYISYIINGTKIEETKKSAQL